MKSRTAAAPVRRLADQLEREVREAMLAGERRGPTAGRGVGECRDVARRHEDGERLARLDARGDAEPLQRELERARRRAVSRFADRRGHSAETPPRTFSDPER